MFHQIKILFCLVRAHLGVCRLSDDGVEHFKSHNFCCFKIDVDVASYISYLTLTKHCWGLLYS